MIHFFAQPIFVVALLCTRIGIPNTSAHSLLMQLENEEVIIALKAGSGNRFARHVFS